jgi:hypothetical protein
VLTYFKEKDLVDEQVTLEGLRLRKLLPGQRSLHIGSGSSLLPIAEALMGLSVWAYDNQSSMFSGSDISLIEAVMEKKGIRNEIRAQGGEFHYEETSDIRNETFDSAFDHIISIDLTLNDPTLLFDHSIPIQKGSVKSNMKEK